MKKINVLHVITRLDKGGAPKNTLLTVSGLDKERYRVTLLSGPSRNPEEDLEERTTKAGVECAVLDELVRPIRPWTDLRAVLKLARFMRRHKLHIVHTHTSKAGVVGRLAFLLARSPLLVHASHGHVFTGFYGPVLSTILLWLDRFLSLFTHRIVALTRRGMEEQIHLGVAPRRKFAVVPSGVELERFTEASVDAVAKREQLGLPPVGPLLGVAAELDPRKGHRYLLEAMPLVLRRRPDAVLLVMGHGPLQQDLQARISLMNLEGSVRMLGHREDMPEMLSLLDVLVLPSLNEGMGRVVVEAMACAKPVVASNVMGIPELVEDGVTGLLCRPANPQDLAEKILRLLEDSELARKMGAAGKERVYPRYDASRMVAAYEALYEALLKEKGLPPDARRKSKEARP